MCSPSSALARKRAGVFATGNDFFLTWENQRFRDSARRQPVCVVLMVTAGRLAGLYGVRTIVFIQKHPSNFQKYRLTLNKRGVS